MTLNNTNDECLAGDSIMTKNANWRFSSEVAKNFDQHVSRSVPFYETGHDLILKLADFFLHDDSLCYELGCSTGKLLCQLAQRNEEKKVSFVGIDCEKDMLDIAKSKCPDSKNTTFIEQNILDLEFKKADLIIAYYTIQFINPKNRQLIINRIYEALNWGGAFILFEKVRGSDARFQDIFTSLYTDYKLDQGYSANEIIAKSRSLKGVLEPFSTNGNMELLQRAGFIDIVTIMKYVCFEGFLAIK